MQTLLGKLLLLLPCFADSGSGLRCAQDSVGMIEVNHFVDSDGMVVLDQVIFWDHSPGLGKMVVRDWRSLKHSSQLPYRTPGGHFQSCWHDATNQNAIRVVSARSVVETVTTYDPEISAQQWVDRNDRCGLSPVKRKQRAK